MPGADLIHRWWHRLRDPGWVRPGPTPRQLRVDALLAAGYLAALLLSMFLLLSAGPLASGDAEETGWPTRLLWILGLSLPMVLRRRFPCSVAVVVSLVFIGAQFGSYIDNTTASVGLFWAMYSVGAWARSRMAAFWVRTVIIIGMLAALVASFLIYSADYLTALGDHDSWLPPQVALALYGIFINIGFFFAAGLFGTASWTSARRRAELRRQAEELAAAQAEVAQRAVLQERLRIARELHDVVAHHVSVMGVQASAARRVLGKSPELAVGALTAVEATARVAIADLRGLLGVLRAGPSEEERGGESYSAAPGLEQLEPLVGQSRSTGLRIDYGVYGDPRPVPAGLALCVFRVVQEALTNVIKHAGAGSVDVRLRYLAGAIEVEISDDGRGDTRRTGSGGFGLIGMRERVAVYGGEVEATGRPDGFRVRARLPLPSPQSDPHPVTADRPAAPAADERAVAR